MLVCQVFSKEEFCRYFGSKLDNDYLFEYHIFSISLWLFQKGQDYCKKDNAIQSMIFSFLNYKLTGDLIGIQIWTLGTLNFEEIFIDC